ncbi:HAD-IA family hydrolase [Niallia circulans]
MAGIYAFKKHELEYSFSRGPHFKKPGLDELLSFLKSQGIKMAVASSSAREVIHRFLTLSDTLPFIDLYVSGEEVPSGKPSPDIFLEVCTRLKVSPKEALVLEDSPLVYKRPILLVFQQFLSLIL